MKFEELEKLSQEKLREMLDELENRIDYGRSIGLSDEDMESDLDEYSDIYSLINWDDEDDDGDWDELEDEIITGNHPFLEPWDI
jgi:hypothetical protein